MPPFFFDVYALILRNSKLLVVVKQISLELHKVWEKDDRVFSPSDFSKFNHTYISFLLSLTAVRATCMLTRVR